MIEILYNNKKDRKTCEDTRYATRRIGVDPARNLAKLINAIISSKDLSDIAAMPQFRLHQLKGDKMDIYSLSINKEFRIEFYPMDENKDILKSGTNEKEMFRKTRYIKITRISKHYE